MFLPATTFWQFLARAAESPRRWRANARAHIPRAEFVLSRGRWRRIYSAAGAALTVHTLAFFAVDRYRQLLADIGDLFTHAKDVSDLPQLLLIGFVLMGLGAVGVAVLLERCLWRLKDDSRSRDQN